LSVLAILFSVLFKLKKKKTVLLFQMLIFYVFNYCYADQHRHANHRHLQNGAALRLVPHHASEDGATENEVSNPLFLIAAVGFDNGDIVVQLWPRMVLWTRLSRNLHRDTPVQFFNAREVIQRLQCFRGCLFERNMCFVQT
jgi:hypothetical protein